MDQIDDQKNYAQSWANIGRAPVPKNLGTVQTHTFQVQEPANDEILLAPTGKQSRKIFDEDGKTWHDKNIVAKVPNLSKRTKINAVRFIVSQPLFKDGVMKKCKETKANVIRMLLRMEKDVPEFEFTPNSLQGAYRQAQTDLIHGKLDKKEITVPDVVKGYFDN